MNQKMILIGVILLLVATAMGGGCSILDPCVRQRDACYEDCPTVIVAKEVCEQQCNIEYDRCEGKY